MATLSAQTHGILDYVVGAALAAIPHAVRCGKPATRVFRAAAIGAGVYSSLTNYERGLVKVLPMEAHLSLDILSGAALIGSAVHLDNERPAVRAMLAGMGVLEIAVAMMTSPRPGQPDAPSPAGRVAEYVTAG